MKITFILPGIGKKKGEEYVKTWRLLEPLSIATVSGLTPDDVEKEFFDDRIELIDFRTKTDLVAISAESYNAKRAYEISGKFRQRNIPVIIGGPHPTFLPDEAAQYADSIFIGNAEDGWEKVIQDLGNGKLKKRYQGTPGFSAKLPDRNIFKPKKYINVGLVETGRGCFHHCEFCAVSSYYQATYFPRNIEDVVNEIKQTDKKYYFLVDDNIFADHQYALMLFKALTPLKIKWISQGSLTVAKNDELLYWAKKSGCSELLIGFESLDMENLVQIKKEWNLKLGNTDELVQKIHKAGIGIYASFVFGFDQDTSDSFDKTLQFSMRNGFSLASFSSLLPFPGTSLYHKLKNEDRLIKEKWWLDDSYKYGSATFTPKKMSTEALAKGCLETRKLFYSMQSIIKRSIMHIARNPHPGLFLYFLSQNLNLKNEVLGKWELELGRGLDELPK